MFSVNLVLEWGIADGTSIQYASASSDNLTLAATGTGDIAEMTETLQDDEAAYAYVRMKLGNDEYSERVKFAFVVWAGTSLLHLTPPYPHHHYPMKTPIQTFLLFVYQQNGGRGRFERC
jgi:hypothetical protein